MDYYCEAEFENYLDYELKKMVISFDKPFMTNLFLFYEQKMTANKAYDILFRFLCKSNPAT